jgi:choline dehydrogenase-like flavoprotein
MYIPWWLYKEQLAGQLNFPRGYQFEMEGRFSAPGISPELLALSNVYGEQLKQEIRRVKGTILYLNMRGEMIPNDECYAEIDPLVTDKFGIPVLKYHWKWTQLEYNQVAHAQKTARAIFKRMGGIIVNPDETPDKAITAGGETIHEAGTARMGASPANSVTDKWNRTWEVPNLRLHDASVFASNPHKNPTLTLMALAMRSSQHLAQEIKAGPVA